MTNITFKSLCVVKKYPAPIITRIKDILKNDGYYKDTDKKVEYKDEKNKAIEYKNTDCKDNLCPIWIRKNF